jgi:hypothetical protein
MSTQQQGAEAELQALIAKRTSDPALLLRVTKALMTTTGTLSGEVAAAIEAVGPDSVSKLLADREAARVARAAAKAFADGLFDGSTVPNLGNESWRQMLSHARQFALEAFPAAEAPPVANADVCVLCHQPLQPEAKQRLLKFDEYIGSR